MNSNAENLALQREVLLARASLYRLQIRYQASTFRQSLSWRHAVAGVARSATARDGLLILAAESMGRHRMAGWLSFAMRALAIARLTSLVITLFSTTSAQTGNSAEPPAP